MKKIPCVSVVIIGRNEADNLSNCIRSVLAIDYPADRFEVIYVDTGSTDTSMEIARSFNIRAVEEHGDFPSPGLARNRGIKEAQHEIIHFVDGDMTMERGYLRRAVGFLSVDKIACVIGDVLERSSDRSFLARVLNYPWSVRESGFVAAPGGGGTFLKSVLEMTGGYNPLILKGQETELGYRLRAKGYRIYMIDHTMGVHDYGIDSFYGLVKRSYLMGISYGMVMTMSRERSYADLFRRARNLVLQGIIFFALTVFLLATGRFLLLLALPILTALYVVVRYWREIFRKRNPYGYAYYLLMHLNKPVVLLGMMAFFLRRFTSVFLRILFGRMVN
jgi:glycosyltransferase involved in cell wall biosynthesis